MAGKQRKTSRPGAAKPRAGGERRKSDGTAAGAPKAGAAKGGVRRGRFAPIAKWAAVAAIWMGVAGGALVGWYAYDLPDISSLTAASRRPSVTVLARDGTVLATFGQVYAAPVTLAEVPPYLVQAIVATEDRHFFSHGGIDFVGVMRAAWTDLRAGAIRQGGSTITQQLAKNLFLTADRTLRRKVQETILALWLEARFTKAQIFSIYLNRVYLGAGTYGFPAAARRYFGHRLADVNLHEAAVLAGLLKAPSRYAPLHDPQAARARGDQVLDNMADAGYLSARDLRAAKAEALRTVGPDAGSGARYFADWAVERVSGYVGEPDRDLVVTTTLDVGLQRAAEAAVRRLLAAEGAKRRVSQGALVAVSPGGAVRAMVGGRDYGESQFNRAVQALRQPGSAFKLFDYLAAFEAGMGPDDRLPDVPISIAGWHPHNYERRYRGVVTLDEAFADSINTVAVQVAQRAGLRQVIDVARRLGITAKLGAHPSLALGTSVVSPLELVCAYAGVANGGLAARPHAVVTIADREGHMLYRRARSRAPRVLAPGIVAEMDRMLARVLVDGTGRAARLDRPAAGKTGTSQDFRDAWFVGYTPGLVAGVWVGNDDDSPMKGVTGGSVPARIWHDFMTKALAGRPPRTIVPPAPAPAPPTVASRPQAVPRAMPAAATPVTSGLSSDGLYHD